MATDPTWEPHEKHGRLTKQGDLPDTVFAFPKQRKEPLTDASHVRSAVARFDQVIDVSEPIARSHLRIFRRSRSTTACTCQRQTGTSSACTHSGCGASRLRRLRSLGVRAGNPLPPKGTQG